MARSTLLQICRDSIVEVLQANHKIDRIKLLKQYPILAEPIACEVTIYLDEKPKSSYKSDASHSLLDNIITASKKAAFEDKTASPLTITEYLHSKLELKLYSSDGILSEKDTPPIEDEALKSLSLL